jgi:hypothetical protein
MIKPIKPVYLGDDGTQTTKMRSSLRDNLPVFEGHLTLGTQNTSLDCRESSVANETAHRKEIFWKFLEIS